MSANSTMSSLSQPRSRYPVEDHSNPDRDHRDPGLISVIPAVSA
jgi:hypothetical protein